MNNALAVFGPVLIGAALLLWAYWLALKAKSRAETCLRIQEEFWVRQRPEEERTVKIWSPDGDTTCPYSRQDLQSAVLYPCGVWGLAFVDGRFQFVK